MSKKKSKQTPAEVASQIAKFLAKQEETLSRYPVGPMANAARMNMKKGYAALEALKGQNETMRMQMEQPQMGQMVLGGTPTLPPEVSASVSSETGLTKGQLDMLNYLKNEAGYSDAIALAAVSVTSKESGGDSMAVERSYRNTAAGDIRGVNERFKEALADKTDAEIDKLKKDDEAFFNLVYENATGNNAPGDGYKYRGRGLIQLTGKGNYKRASQAIFGNDSLVENPDLLLDEAIAGQVAGWFTSTSGGGVAKYLDFDVSESNPSPEQLQQALNGAYATIASGGTLSKKKAQDSEFMAKNYNQYSVSMPKMQAFTETAIPAVSDSAAYNQAFSPNPPEAPAQTPEEPAATVTEEPAPQPPAQPSDNELMARSMGWTPETNISADRFMEKLEEAEKANPGKSLSFFPDAGVEDGGFFSTAGSIGLPAAPVVTERRRDAQGRPIFSSMIDKINYDNYNAGGEDFLRRGMDMTSSIHEATDDFARKFLQPTLYTGLALGTLGASTGLSQIPAVARAAQAATNLGARALTSAGEFGTALNTVGGQFARGSIYNAPGFLGSASLAGGISSGIMGATGDLGLTDRENAFEVANNPNYTPAQKAAHFATLGIELSPVVFKSPTAIRNIFRGRPSDFPGSYASFLNAKRALNLGADDATAVANKAEDAYQAARATRVGSTGTAVKAGKADLKASNLQKKAAEAQDEVANATSTAQARAKQAKADKAAGKAAKAQAKADKAKAADNAALKQQQAANARRLNARGRAGVADDELATFNQRYNAAAEPLTLSPLQRLPVQAAGIVEAANRIPALMRNTEVDPVNVNPVNVQVGNTTMPAPASDPVTVPSVANRPELVGGQPPVPENTVSTGDGLETRFEDGETPVQGQTGTGTTTDGTASMTPDTFSFNMGRGNLMMGIPAAAALGSAAIQGRALQQMQAPVAPITTDIPAFNYQSTIGQQLQDVRDSTQAMSRADGMSETARAAMRGSLLGERFRQEQRLQTADNAARQQARRSYDALAAQMRQSNNALRNQYLNDARTFRNDMTQAQADIRQAPLDVGANFAQDYLKNIYFPQQSLAIEQVGRMGQYGLPQSVEEEQNP